MNRSVLAPEPTAPSLAHLLCVAGLAALLVHVSEASIAWWGDSALLRALPGPSRALYVLSLVAAFPLVALAAAVVAWPLGRWSRVAGLTAAATLPPAILAVEALRHAGEIRGTGVSWLLAGAAVSAAVALVAAPWRAAPARPRASRVAIAGLVAPASALLLIQMLGSPSELAEAGSSPNLDVAPVASRRAVDPPKNLLVLLVDTLRADHLGCYGYARQTSPNIDAFAAGGTLFEHAVTPKPKTSPAVASLFTGLFPQSHGIHVTSTILPAEHRTLAELLKDDGFSTFGVSANVNVTREFGFDQGFDEFVRVERLRKRREVLRDKDADRLRDHLFDWLSRRGDERWFAYLQFIDPHAPYSAPEPYHSMFRGDALDGRLGERDLPLSDDEPVDSIQRHAYLPDLRGDLDGYVARYDGEIRFTDEVIGEILDALREQGHADDTLVVITADHGEALVDHHVYFHHGSNPYDEHVRIPMIFGGPGVSAGRRREVVSLVGLTATLLDVMGVAAPEWLEAPPFTALLEGAAPDDRDGREFLSTRMGRDLTEGVRTAEWKYLERERGIVPEELTRWKNLLLPGKRVVFTLSALRDYELSRELYHVAEDPNETRNLALIRPEVAERLAADLASFRRRASDRWPQPVQPNEDDLDGDVADDLRQMGYLGR